MNKLNLIIGLVLTLFILSSFTEQLFKTTLKVNVRNDLGNLESGADVSLFKTKEDYEKEENTVVTGKTDAKGNVQFQDLEAMEYYILVEKGDKNNMGAGEKTEKLVPNKLNKATIIISE